jgi:purine-nucleoside phosphorylase
MGSDEILNAAVEYVSAGVPDELSVAIILGSGLSDVARIMDEFVSVEYRSIPGFPAAGAPGHAGTLLVGRIAGVNAAIMSGRPHLYEGYDRTAVTFPVRLFGRLGAGALIVTNAAGAVNPAFRAGDMMLITDHIDLTFTTSLTSTPSAVPFFRPGFRYDEDLLEITRREAGELGVTDLKEGTYAALTGPNYETGAELVMLERIGADAVGMSTAMEASEAFGLGMRVLGISCIANAREKTDRLTHDDVERIVEGVAATLGCLIVTIVAHIGDRKSAG